MRKNLKTYQRLSLLPMGKQLFSFIVCRVAPYFASIRPQITSLRPGFAEVQIKKRRRVTNHINTVHAIAMCNMAELAGGMMTDVSVPIKSRWIPVGMTVEYLNKAKTDLTAHAQGEHINWETEGDKIVPVEVRDQNGEMVFRAEITMNVRH
ncbi:hotdog fold domain-containing protein [Photobacterium sp. GSS17]|uniref:hotdog fold domain-containing protein n=1 Tax=Photobacterium sp. GSS17 TaxID=3020715 RepID=UPI0023627EB3|nr:hotdog fold domain-containing protein [Photobacterium sp. GSS17]